MNKEVNILPKYRANIIGSGSAVPEKILTNEQLSKMIDTSDKWITTRTGIKTRHISNENETTALLATNAAKNAVEMAGIDPAEIELIIVATVTPEMVFPSTAAFVQHNIGAKNAFVFDLAAACSGFVYALSIAQNYIEAGNMKTALIIGAETLTKITDFKDRGSCILFGDGAGAVVVQRSEENKGIIYSNKGSNGTEWEVLCCQAHGSRYPSSKPLEDPSKKYMRIRGREVYQQAVRTIVDTVEDCLEKCNMTCDDIDMLIPHQMNMRIIESVAKRLSLPDERVFVNIADVGNTSAASIPLAFDNCYRQGLIKKGNKVIFVAFGAGLTWGANVIQF
jgi:3-oxoacyl-[acyl-carrier-protein] synthase-3